MNIALIMNDNSYAGREYLARLAEKKISIDVILIGNFPENNINEDKRCGNLWKPTPIKLLSKFHHFFKFESLRSNNLISFLDHKKYFIGIQGGTGILKDNIINKFRNGILNFHPGDLPYYRGCSAPEWQLFENKPIISSCHQIDKGIDTGPILRKKKLDLDMNSYESFRASIYPQTAIFVSEIIYDILNSKQEMNYVIQDESEALYRKYITDKVILKLKNNYFKIVLN